MSQVVNYQQRSSPSGISNVMKVGQVAADVWTGNHTKALMDSAAPGTPISGIYSAYNSGQNLYQQQKGPGAMDRRQDALSGQPTFAGRQMNESYSMANPYSQNDPYNLLQIQQRRYGVMGDY